MKEGNKQFLKAIGSIVAINIAINLLPPPLGMIVFFGFILWFLYDLYNNTRF